MRQFRVDASKKIAASTGCSYSEALANFKFIYPEVSVTNLGENADGSGYVVETDDGGYHTISDKQISRYFDSYDRAYNYSLRGW